MTIEEKAGAIKGYCEVRKHCNGCPLHEKQRGNCYSNLSDKDIEANFHKLFDAEMQPMNGLCEESTIDWNAPHVLIKRAENVYINYTTNHFEKLEEDPE